MSNPLKTKQALVQSPEFRELQALLEEKKRRKPKENKDGSTYWPHDPHPKQKEFLDLDCLEALYGGAAGGGKTDALLMAALQYAHVPGYNAIIFRRKFTDLSLPSSAMNRAKVWLAPTDAYWIERDKRFTFPSGATLSFGYLDKEDDKFRYASAEFSFISFDELTQFPESWYTFLFSRLRRPETVKSPLRMRAASNPGSIGHDWVKRRFVDRADPTCVFIPAKLDDNPSINATEYELSLSRLDPIVQRQLREGLWVRDDNGLVYRMSDKTVLEGFPETNSHILAIDFGFKDSTAFVIYGMRDHDSATYILNSFKRQGMTPSQVAELVAELDDRYKFDSIVGDPGGLGKGYIEEGKQRFGLPMKIAEKRNKRGYIDLLNGDLARHQLLICPGNEALVSEMAELPWNHDRSLPEHGFEDHLCDAMLYGWRECRSYLNQPREASGPKLGTREYYSKIEAEIEEANTKPKVEQAWWETWDGTEGF
jgi:hypothetical protein